jgi:glycolate oxidase iron-sulfur subunit
MQTSFTKRQLAEPAIAEADGILKTCVHYGFCTSTCPTYVLFRDENDSPRGRIDLIRAMLEKGGRPDPKVVHHLDRCLSCHACMTTCAVKVDYMHLSDIARAHIERRYRRPLPERILRAFLAGVLPYPRRFAAALALGRMARPVAPWLPGRLRALLELLPDGAATRPAELGVAVHPAEGVRRRRVALLAGCAQQVLNPAINAATIRLLQRHGCEVVIVEGAGCCGALTLHMGREDDARAAAAANIRAWAREIDRNGLDAIVVNASGCGTTVKDYGHLFRRDAALAETARRIAGLTRDVTELMHDLGLRPPPAPRRYRVAFHDACSMQHAQKIVAQPRALLRAAGFDVVDVPEGHFCCGSAGTYNMLQPAIAATLGQRKAGHIASTDPDIVAMGNIGCMVQLERYLGRPVVHTVELLDWATGGPMPPRLAAARLRDPPPGAAAAAPGATDKTDNVGVW